MDVEPVRVDLQARLASHGRSLVSLGALMFGVSVAFPISASLSRQEVLPTWIGYVDVTVAFALVFLAGLIGTITKWKASNDRIHLSYRIYRAMATLPLILLILFFLFGEWIKWNILLPGLAWRAWLLLYTLPLTLTLWEMDKATGDQDAKTSVPGD